MLEMAHNGDLLDYINKWKVMLEPEARFVMRSIASGIAYCHNKGIVHRDLKCENIMVTGEMKIKIGGKLRLTIIAMANLLVLVCRIYRIVFLLYTTYEVYYFILLFYRFWICSTDR